MKGHFGLNFSSQEIQRKAAFVDSSRIVCVITIRGKQQVSGLLNLMTKKLPSLDNLMITVLTINLSYYIFRKPQIKHNGILCQNLSNYPCFFLHTIYHSNSSSFSQVVSKI